MISREFVIINKSEHQDVLHEYGVQYSYMFRYIYSNMELFTDSNFIKKTLSKFPLFDRRIYEFCISDVKAKHTQIETHYSQSKEEINYLIKKLDDLNNIPKEKRDWKINKSIRKTISKLKHKKQRLDKDVVFGGLANLQKITKYKQEGNIELYNKYLKIFQDNRNIGFYAVGQAWNEGNRKFNFDLTNGLITFKPDRKTKIILKVKPYHIKKEEIEKLSNMIKNKQLPVTVRLFPDRICLSYDNEKLNGYEFKANEYKKEIIGKTPIEKKEIAKKYFDNRRNRMLKGKNPNRYASIDLNPERIGFSIIEKDGDKIKILYKICFDYSKLLKKKQGKKNNKLGNKINFELTQIYKQIFTITTHYKCAHFIIEDLDFSSPKNNDKIKSTEFNRKTKTLWNRGLQEKLILKYTQNLGIELIKINPVYTSFIGNMEHKEYDPIASSLEIGRRGIVKYTKGSSIYPEISKTTLEKMSYLLGNNWREESGLDLKNKINWRNLYTLLVQRNLRYRNSTETWERDKFLNKNSNVFKSL